MAGAKPVQTPISLTFHNSSNDDVLADPTLYRKIVGGLQYITLTRPDLTFAVNTISEHV